MFPASTSASKAYTLFLSVLLKQKKLVCEKYHALLTSDIFENCWLRSCGQLKLKKRGEIQLEEQERRM